MGSRWRQNRLEAQSILKIAWWGWNRVLWRKIHVWGHIEICCVILSTNYRRHRIENLFRWLVLKLVSRRSMLLWLTQVEISAIVGIPLAFDTLAELYSWWLGKTHRLLLLLRRHIWTLLRLENAWLLNRLRQSIHLGLFISFDLLQYLLVFPISFSGFFLFLLLTNGILFLLLFILLPFFGKIEISAILCPITLCVGIFAHIFLFY